MIHTIYITTIVLSILVTWYVATWWAEQTYQPIIDQLYAAVYNNSKPARIPADDEQQEALDQVEKSVDHLQETVKNLKPELRISYQDTPDMIKQHKLKYYNLKDYSDNTPGYWQAEEEFKHDQLLDDIYGPQDKRIPGTGC